MPLAFIRYFELPDLDFIARHGLSADAAIPTPVTLTVSATARSGSPAAVRRCQEEGAAAAAALRDAYIPLQRQWFRQLAALRGDPATVKALRALPDCLAGHGVQAPDEQGFMAVADAREQTATAAELPYTEGELGRTYALCMRPVEAVREPARRRLRTRFLTDHADEIRDLRETFLPALHRAEQRYGVPLVFPAP